MTAGYSAKTKGEIAYELIRRPRIIEFIKAIRDDIAYQLGISAYDIALEYAKIGFSDIRKVFDPETGDMLDINAIDAHTTASIASLDVTEVYERGVFKGTNKKMKFHDKITALDKLARMLGVDAKGNALEAPKPEPLTIVVKHAKVKIDGNNGIIGKNPE